jgi:hypothetical protein
VARVFCLVLLVLEASKAGASVAMLRFRIRMIVTLGGGALIGLICQLVFR